MPFFLFLVFGVWFLLLCLGSNGKQAARRKNFPSCRYQEELLLFYEKFFEYRQDPSRADPVGDALEDARYELWQQGYLPSSFITYGMSDWNQRPVARRAWFTKGIKIRVLPFYGDLLLMRELDRRSGEHNMSGEYLEYRGKDLVFNQERWDAYCAKIDKRFERLWKTSQPPFNYSITDRLTDSDIFDVLHQGGKICNHHSTGWWTATFEGRFVGFCHQGMASYNRHIIGDGVKKSYDKATNCTYYYDPTPLESKKQSCYALGFTSEPFCVNYPITFEIELLNRKWAKEWQMEGTGKSAKAWPDS